MINDLFFTHMPLDRESTNRKSELWIAEQRENKQSKFVPMWKGDYFFTSAPNDEDKLVEFSCWSEILGITRKYSRDVKEACYYLGRDLTHAPSQIFIVDLSLVISNLAQAIIDISSFIAKEIRLLGFRQSIAFLAKEHASTLGYGRSLSNWHQSAQFCGCCGNKTLSQEGGHSRLCTEQSCRQLSFPRTDPVVIMLVEYKEKGQPTKCLLAAHKRSPEHLFSTIAGFVDPGESLEQAVIREVHEEVGLEVKEVEYMASQPWAFPNSLMIGFYVKAKSNTITIDTEELTNASWFTVEEVKSFSDWGEENNNIQIPRKESISRCLIEHWLSRNTD
ncbi:NAD(+) diphosphatase [Colwelliaceae bacterium 6441]